MKINSLRLKNFRCFEEITVNFEENLTVIVAENGQGKTSLLDAIRIGVWPFIKSFDLAKTSTFNDPSNGITVDDVRMIYLQESGMARQLPAEVELTAAIDSKTKSWLRYREKEDRKSKTLDSPLAKELSLLSKEIQTKIRDASGIHETLPVFGYYGTGRLWAQKKLIDRDDLSENEKKDLAIRTFAYKNCMDPASSYKHFRAWFIGIWESRMNMFMLKSVTESEKKLAEDRILVIQKTIDVFLKPTTGWHSLEYYNDDQRTLILNHDQNGRMNVDYLSDGIRNMLALVGDIAYRCIKLNPHLGADAAFKTEGVVLIDEIDMHLHPRWQQTVLDQLREAFPNIQFIVTTHSPQVLTTVASNCIRILKDTKVYAAPAGSEGADPSRLLKQVLGLSDVRPLSNKATQELREYLSLVDQDLWESSRAKELRRILDTRYQGNEPELFEADLRIENRKWELGT